MVAKLTFPLDEITLAVDVSVMAAATASLRSICEVLETSPDLRKLVAECFPENFSAEPGGGSNLLIKGSDFFLREPEMRIAGGTIEWLAIPSDRYLELIAAIAGNGQCSVETLSHGWPILSLECGTPSMTEAGGESIAPGGGPTA